MTHKRNRRKREWQRRHEDILVAAATLFHTHGFEGTSMRAMADHVGFSVGYLYKHFPGKTELLDAVLEKVFEFLERIRADVSADESLSPLAQLRLEMRYACDFLSEHSSLVLVFTQQENYLAPRLQERLIRYRSYAVRRLRNAHAAGEIAPVDFGLLAVVLDGVFMNLIRKFASASPPEDFSLIPGIIDQYVLRPLTESRQSKDGKEPPLA